MNYKNKYKFIFLKNIKVNISNISQSVLTKLFLYVLDMYMKKVEVLKLKPCDKIYFFKYLTNYLHGLWNPEVQCRIHKDSPTIPILSRINPNTRIDTYRFKVRSNIVSHLRVGLPKCLFPAGLPVKILKALLPSSILAACPA